MAYETPRPVERMEVGKVSAEMRLKKAKATVLNSLLRPMSIKPPALESVNCTQMPRVPERTMRMMIHSLRFISWQKKLVKKQLQN